MARRKAVHRTGIPRVEGVAFHDAWITYACVSCQAINRIKQGTTLLAPDEAYDEAVWACEKCGYAHSKESELPFPHWNYENRVEDSKAAEYFWRGFFRTSTERPDSYWKQCNVCGRILPFNAYSRHRGWGPLQRQMECRACKGAINAVLNPKRTKQQLHEASLKRRIADLLVEGENEQINHGDLFERFGARCFKTGQQLDITERSSWAIDHILPSKWLYPLSLRNAALLSRQANEGKADRWPSQFYTNQELIDLARLTGADLNLLSSPTPILNRGIDVNRGVERYLQVRDRSNLGKRIRELKKILKYYGLQDRLTEENKKLLGIS